VNFIKLAITYLLPVAVATTTILAPQDRGFSVGTGEQRPLDYLVATYVPTEEVKITPKEVVFTVFGKDADNAWKVAICESGGLQAYPNGEVVMGKLTPDYGLMQINEVHLKDAQNKGYDIRILEDNVSYAKLLFDSYGWKPWYSSQSCHGL
jgi:hypothetical protein